MVKNYRFVVLILMAALVLAGCDSKETVNRKDFAAGRLNSEALLGEGDTPNLNNLIGGMNPNDLMNVLANALDTLDELSKQGLTTAQDYATLKGIIEKLYDHMKAEKAEYDALSPEEQNQEKIDAEAASNDMARMLELAVENRVGVLLDQVLDNTPDRANLIRSNIYPMLAYVMAADGQVLENAAGGGPAVDLKGLTVDATHQAALKALLKDALDDGNGDPAKHGQLNKAFKNLYDAVKVLAESQDSDPTKEMTVGELKDMLGLNSDDSSANDAAEAEDDESVDADIMAAVLDVVIGYLGTQDGFQKDTRDLLNSLANLLIEDSAEILVDVLDILDSTHYSDAQLKEFAKNAMIGATTKADSNVTTDMLVPLSRIGRDNVAGIGLGLEDWFVCNMYGQERTGSDTPKDLWGDDFEVDMSWFRSLALMLEASDFVPELLGSPMMEGTESDDAFPGRPTIGHEGVVNMGAWTIGEVVTAIKAARIANQCGSADYASQYFVAFGNEPYVKYDSIKSADFNGDGTITSLEVFDWVLYRKNYNMMSIMQFDGLVGMMDSTVSLTFMLPVPHAVFDNFAAFVYLAGGNIDFNKPVDSVYGTAGTKHNLFALFGTLMEYYWDIDNIDAMNGMLIGLNEFANPGDKKVFGPNSKFTVCGEDSEPALSIMRVVEGHSADGEIGKGLTYRLLRAHGDDGVVDPALKLVIGLLAELDQARDTYPDGVLQALVDELPVHAAPTAEDVAADVDEMFGEDGPANLVDKIGNNRNEIKAVMVALGETLQVVADEGTWSNVCTLLNLVSGAEVSAGSGEPSTMSDLLDYLTATNADGSDNELISNAKLLGCKILDLQDDTYNPGGTINDETKLSDAIAHLVKEEPTKGENGEIIVDDGLYEVYFIKNFIDDLKKESESANDDLDGLLDSVVELVLPIAGGEKEPTLIETLGLGDLELSFIQALFVDVDARGSVVKQLLDVIHLENVEMNGLLSELHDLSSEGGEPMTPGSHAYIELLNTLEFVLNNMSIH